MLFTLDFELLAECSLRLRDAQGATHTLVLGIDRVRLDVVRELKGTFLGPARDFTVQTVQLLSFLLRGMFRTHRQHPVLEGDLDVLPLETGQRE